MGLDHDNSVSRRGFLAAGARGLGVLAIGGVIGVLLNQQRSGAHELVWQIDPAKCIQCGKCATNCVLNPSAVKCIHTFALCGYCDLCTGYFEAQPNQQTTAAENQLCPTGAIARNFVEDPYYQYVIDRKLCIGCAKCVKGCGTFGNGSLHLQIDHDLCVHCNWCSIAAVCPSEAIARIPAHKTAENPTPGYIDTRIRGT